MVVTERHARGRLAEEFVAAELARNGYEILGRNVRVGALELDIVARNGAVLVIVEVRTRGARSWGSALESVTAEKQRRLRRASEILWSRRFSRWPSLERVRFDVASVELVPDSTPRLTYVEAAFV